MNKVAILLGFTCILALSSCDKGVDSPRGFSLPEGNPELGKQVFLNRNCLSCHSIAGLEDEDVKREHSPPIAIGSNSAIVTTYAELVSSIINPSHRISRGARWATSTDSGDSVMRNYNDILTVSELINVVSYLQPHYKVTPLPYTPYSVYEVTKGGD